MSAPRRFAAWLSSNVHRDRRFGHLYRYHPRSDVHSVMLCTYIFEDLLERCSTLREQASRGEVGYGINVRHIWSTTGKAKTMDLAVGRPASPITSNKTGQVSKFSDVFFACEAKSVMTEHGKSQPRVYDELSSSHEIVHQGQPNAIATGITVVILPELCLAPSANRRRPAPHLFAYPTTSHGETGDTPTRASNS